MDAEIQDVIRRIHSRPAQAVVAAAGGGAQAVGWLLKVPGASRTVLEALVPYSERALADFLGERPHQIASVETAEAMSRRAYLRAVELADADAPVVGIGCTAAIATDRVKRGPHRVHVARCTADSVVTYSLEFTKGLRDREGEDTLAGLLVVRALAEAAAVSFDAVLPLAASERIEVGGSDRELAAVASETLSMPVTLEMSVANVDKPPLTASVIRERLDQFAGTYDVVLTKAPTFAEKVQALPGTCFVIGYDTMVRLIEPAYYEDDERKMMSALASIRKLGGRFLVAGRLDNGTFRTLADVPPPDEFRDMFTAIPEHRFRRDISSTCLRTS